MRKLYFKICSVITAVLLIITSCIMPVTVFALSNTNIFTLRYIEENGDVKVQLSVDGMLNLSGFDSVLSYDSQKYTVKSTNVLCSNTIVNVKSDKSEVNTSFGSIQNISKPTAFCEIIFHTTGKSSVSDFKFQLSNAYDENMNFVDFTLNTIWNDEQTNSTTTQQQTTIATSSTYQATTKLTTTTKTTSIGQTDLTTATIPVQNKNNIFYYFEKYNKESNCVEFTFGIKGNVEFASIDGNFTFDLSGLDEPILIESASGMMSNYSNKQLFYSFTSNGENITDSMVLFKYNFKVNSNNYKFNVKPIISNVADMNNYIYDYSVVNESDDSKSDTTTTATSKSVTSTTQTTTKPVTSKSVTSTTQTTSKPVTSKSVTSTTQTTSKPVTSKSVTSTTQTTTKPITSRSVISTTQTTSKQITSMSSTLTTTITASTTSTSNRHISPYEFANWAENDYYQKTGEIPFSSDYKEILDGIITITLYNETGNIIDVYNINAKSGTGTDNNGAEVNLPQTGYKYSLYDIIAIALAIISCGLSLITYSHFYKNCKNYKDLK